MYVYVLYYVVINKIIMIPIIIMIDYMNEWREGGIFLINCTNERKTRFFFLDQKENIFQFRKTREIKKK